MKSCVFSSSVLLKVAKKIQNDLNVKFMVHLFSQMVLKIKNVVDEKGGRQNMDKLLSLIVHHYHSDGSVIQVVQHICKCKLEQIMP